MPYTPKRYCPAPGCPELTSGGRCLAHRRSQQASLNARRPNPKQRGYDRDWQQLRKKKLAENPFCEIGTHCSWLPLHRRIATEVDHIIPIRIRPELRLVWINLQSACHRCHSAKTMREMRGTTNANETRGATP